jgi:hypothetical protein
MSDSNHQRHESSSGVTWVVSIIGALLVYALSVGPVVKISTALYGPKPPPSLIRTIEVVYAPLGYAVQYPAVQEFYDWYFKLWRVE